MDRTLALPHIDHLQSYVPGMPIETLAREKSLTNIIKLASNENPLGPSPKVLETITKNLDSIHRYPDADMHNLKKALGMFYNLPSNMFVIGNGTDEIIQMIMRVFVCADNNVIAPQYSFSSYKISAASINAPYIESRINADWTNDLDHLLTCIDNNTKLICLANPNNPTGSSVDIKAIAKFLAKVPPHILVLLDEAYHEYSYYEKLQPNHKVNDDPSIALLDQHKNLMITRTFSKAYGLAGLRVGYCIADAAVIACLNKIKQPFNVNRLAQFAAVAALEDQEYIQKSIAINTKEKLTLYEQFKRLQIHCIPSATNFITIITPKSEDSQNLYNYLLNQGIITRPLHNYGLHSHLRISIGLPHENKALVDALEKYMIVY